MSKPAKPVIHILDNTEIEDEADIFAYTFEVAGSVVVVTPRYNGYPERETPSVYTRVEAREAWKNCIKSGFAPRAARA